MGMRRKSGLVGSLSVGSTIPMVVLLLVTGGITLALLDSNIDLLVAEDTDGTMDLMEEIINAEVNGAVTNYLRGVAESNRDLMEYY